MGRLKSEFEWKELGVKVFKKACHSATVLPILKKWNFLPENSCSQERRGKEDSPDS